VFILLVINSFSYLLIILTSDEGIRPMQLEFHCLLISW